MKTFGIMTLMGMLFLQGCATRKWVRNEVGIVNTRVTAVETAGRANAERIDAVERRAQQGVTAAAAADTKAIQAGTAAAAAQTGATNAQRQSDAANQGVQQATTRINTLESRLGGLDTYTLAGQPVSVTFGSGSAILSDEAKAALDTVASGVSGSRGGFLLELQGYTDSQGSEAANDALSQRRAESVLRYLVSRNVPLFRVSIVGLGETNPIGPNDNAAGRQQNRRVEIRTLRAG